MKYGFVVPRYGRDVPGGAEQAARLFAEHLVAELGWPVEVFTTCAIDSRTWANHYPEGTTHEAGVTVHRFRSEAGRAPDFDERSGEMLRSVHTLSPSQQEEWLRIQGPVCPAAVDAALSSDAERLAAYPYLYLPMIDAIRRGGNRVVLHPAAHDELPLHLSLFDEVFMRCYGLVLQTEAEAALIARRFPDTAAQRQIVLGIGVDDPIDIDQQVARDAFGLGDRPYLVCVGRLDPTKGTDLLVRYFAEYKARNPGPLTLLLLGQVVNAPPSRPDIVAPGVVSDELKWSALRGAATLVSPSVYEAFSMVVLEAWLAGIPVLVNAACGPTVEHSRLSRGGLWFGGYADFEVMVDRLVADPAVGQALAAAGARYVKDRFLWPGLVRRYATFVGGAEVPLTPDADA